MEDMEDELQDRFGDIPRPVTNLLNIAVIKALAHEVYITKISGNKSSITLELYNRAPFDTVLIPAMIKNYRNTLKFVAGATPKFIYTPKTSFKDSRLMLSSLSELFVNIKGIVDNP